MLCYIILFINVVTFLVYGIDKWKAKQGSWRISEATLLILAVFGGSIGAFGTDSTYLFHLQLFASFLRLTDRD